MNSAHSDTVASLCIVVLQYLKASNVIPCLIKFVMNRGQAPATYSVKESL